MLDLKEGERVWINLVDAGPPDMRRATATGEATVDVDAKNHSWTPMSRIKIDGEPSAGWFFDWRITRFSPLEVLAEI